MVSLALGEISGLIQISLIHQPPATHEHLLSLMDYIPASLSSLHKPVIAYSFYGTTNQKNNPLHPRLQLIKTP